MPGGRPGVARVWLRAVASPLYPKAAWPAPSGPSVTQGSTCPASLRGQGPGRQPDPLRGPWCPGGWAFRRQTLHRGPTASAPPSPPSCRCCGHHSEGTAPASPTPRRSDSPHSRPGWSHLSAPLHGSLTPKVLPQGWLRAGHSCYSPSFPATPSPVLVTPGPGFPAHELDSSTQPQRAPVPEDQEEEGPCRQILGRSSPPSCPPPHRMGLGLGRAVRNRDPGAGPTAPPSAPRAGSCSCPRGQVRVAQPGPV